MNSTRSLWTRVDSKCTASQGRQQQKSVSQCHACNERHSGWELHIYGVTPLKENDHELKPLALLYCVSIVVQEKRFPHLPRPMIAGHLDTIINPLARS